MIPGFEIFQESGVIDFSTVDESWKFRSTQVYFPIQNADSFLYPLGYNDVDWLFIYRPISGTIYMTSLSNGFKFRTFDVNTSLSMSLFSRTT